MVRLSLLASLLSLCVAVSARPVSVHVTLPSAAGAALSRFAFFGPLGQQLELQAYIDEDEQSSAASAKTVVIAVHGHDRDAWNTFSQAKKARDQAIKAGAPGPIAIVAPMFLNGDDKGMYEGSNGKNGSDRLLVWKGDGWGQGLPAQFPADKAGQGPDGAAGPGVSSFDALDRLGSHYADTNLFPKLTNVIYLGHSMGGQLIQRYSIVGGGPSARTGLSVSYVVANPSTYLWLDDKRPGVQSPDQNKYKYGLDGMREALAIYEPAQHDAAELWTRYATRTVHYLHGDADNGKGDGRAAAMAQGKNRKQRAHNWHAFIASRGTPAGHTEDWVPGVGHDGGGMFASTAGQKQIFGV
ncbi:hypothetical protein FA09DRAFT_329926 [Tilletiopsis washingtonensis]|uniref:AB hydrolase-1 domain-containing protein n=1 Tax=Tilletiopsis washingtonensis TaxID=58919 RepID=A0A316Z9A4_9BASI|nr:hypothetical protein FA09DRAFT_329926 [Tilletiopsis washingtonensis]PWN98330.1 hypothetical protein FA09DRAFT_329926 [Tilletiopsis washingtonensis]